VPISHLLQGKRARINLSPAASGMTWQNHRQLPVNIFSVKIAALGLRSRLPEGFSKLVSNIKEPAKTLSFVFSLTKQQKIVKTPQRMYRNYLFIIINLKKIFISWHNPFNSLCGRQRICVPVDYQKYDLPDITGPTIVTIGVDIKDIPKV
jgi:hypothetical protein